MKDEQVLEEKLMGELDLMYRHVVDLENGQVPVEHITTQTSMGKFQTKRSHLTQKSSLSPDRESICPPGSHRKHQKHQKKNRGG